MPAVVRTVRSGNESVDGLLHTLKWATSSLTFSFPDAASDYSGYRGGEEPYENFEALNGAQQAVVESILASISAVANITFTKGRGGVGDLRFGMTDSTETAHAYTPATADWGGDSWYNNSSGWFDAPARGNYGYMAFLHEIGHALGLKHPHEDYQFGTVPPNHDHMSYSVMSYRSYPNYPLDRGYNNEVNGYAQSLMMLDIAALQHLYGANFDESPVDSVYRWDFATGELLINGVAQGRPGKPQPFQTIWDGGGRDTYNLSNSEENLYVDLNPGAWSIIADRPRVGTTRMPPGNIANALMFQGDERSLIENAIGGIGSDRLEGNQASNRLVGGSGDDYLDGRAGRDILSGGNGNDFYVIDSEDIFTELTNQGRDTIKVSFSYELPAEFERLYLGGNASINGTGNDVANKIVGNRGHNVIDGGAGGDLMEGGIGRDTYYVDSRYDVVQEWPFHGIDTVYCSVDFIISSHVERVFAQGSSPVDVTGSDWDNWITGNARNNRLLGRSGDDVLNGGAGADFLDGGSGNDLFYVDNPNDRVVEAGAYGGVDRVVSSVSFELAADIESLQLTGRLATAATGNRANNELVGNAVANMIQGGAGQDRISGRGGSDQLRGGAGEDAFCFDSRLSGTSNVDSLLDFSSARDTIFLHKSIFAGLDQGQLQADSFHRGRVADVASDRILYDRPSGELYYDADGSGEIAAVLFARLQPGALVNNADFNVYG